MSGSELKPFGEDLPNEVRELAETLRVLFSSLNLSMRRYASRCHSDAGTVSRYLSGLRTPPWSFVEGLLTHVAQERREPATQEAMTHLRGLHRRAVVASKSEGKAQELQLLLEEADEEARQFKAREQMTADLLQERQNRIQQLQVQLRAVEAARAIDSESHQQALTDQYQQQEALQGECNRLQAEVQTLRAQLVDAQAATALAETRCAQLERQLDAAEEEEYRKENDHDKGQRHADADKGPGEYIKQVEGGPAANDNTSSRAARGPLLREYKLTGAFHRSGAHTASVLHYNNGGYSIVFPHQATHHNKPLLGRPFAVTEVLLGVHSSSFSMLLPAAGGVDFFSVEADVHWEVSDPYAVVHARLLDVEQMLAPELQDRLRTVSHRYPLDQANEAWQAMRRALDEENGVLGQHLGLSTRTYVRVDLDRAQVRDRVRRYQAALENGDTQELAYLMARSPADAASIFSLLREERREVRREELLLQIIDRGLVSSDDVSKINAIITDSVSRPLALPPVDKATPASGQDSDDAVASLVQPPLPSDPVSEDAEPTLSRAAAVNDKEEQAPQPTTKDFVPEVAALGQDDPSASSVRTENLTAAPAQMVRGVRNPDRDARQVHEQALSRSPSEFLELYARMNPEERAMMRRALARRTPIDRKQIKEGLEKIEVEKPLRTKLPGWD
ncbi:hypothetical protein PV726_47115 [Streptomyces europaeiscabiei]|uniref:hypothetical protein n=1 Tax=Streptomyces europaeiscabiei TaxID=146819 RepID=UPI0029A7DB47|nr:hypothetical protein [Streptomyces europaeiscabiei]MDX3697628.1 hypothetical protein [Streptomyces europaeiscabiei]